MTYKTAKIMATRDREPLLQNGWWSVDHLGRNDPWELDHGRRLSSVLTPLYKLGFPATLVAVGVISTIAAVGQIPVGHLVLQGLLFWAILLVMAHSGSRLKRVVAYSDHLVVDNYLTDCRVPYEDIDEVKGYRGRSLVLIRLRLRAACRFGRTIHVALPSTFAPMRSQPEILLLQEQCPHLHEQPRRWLGPRLLLRRPIDDDSRP